MGNRTLSAALVKRLREVAEPNGGLVPLHDRLFAWWMHFAYPQECPYPHRSKILTETNLTHFEASEMKDYLERLPVASSTSGFKEDADAEGILCAAMWNPEEELIDGFN